MILVWTQSPSFVIVYDTYLPTSERIDIMNETETLSDSLRSCLIYPRIVFSKSVGSRDRLEWSG